MDKENPGSRNTGQCDIPSWAIPLTPMPGAGRVVWHLGRGAPPASDDELCFLNKSLHLPDPQFPYLENAETIPVSRCS